MSDTKRVRNEKLHAVLHELRRRAKKDHDTPPQCAWAVWEVCADMVQTVLNASAEEINARPVTVALPKFRPGQSVWVVRQEQLTKTCPCCGGTPLITGQDGSQYPCCHCNGGRVFDRYEYVPRQLAVHKVGMFLSSGGTCEVETLYVLERGGLSMGTYDNIEEYRLHATEEECRATCDRMNAGEWGRAI